MEITIRCLGCNTITAQGGVTQLPTQDQSVALAQHNLGCAINRHDHRTMIHMEEVPTFHMEEIDGEEKRVEDKKTVYTILVFPGYRD